MLKLSVLLCLLGAVAVIGAADSSTAEDFGSPSNACSKTCYDRLGCFSNCPPYGGTLLRPVTHMPKSPEEIDAQFLLLTRDNPDQYEVISVFNPSSLSATHFNSSKNCVFIIHGYTQSGYEAWLMTMCKNLLQASDINCFIVDWREGASGLYTKAVNNAQVAGAEVAYFVMYINATYNYSQSNVHLIGHSLGAHVAGEAGKRLRAVGRITGLDPAGPLFDDIPPEVRLDQSDALFVDCIHTDGSFFLGVSGNGSSQPCGHMDFYPNGGENMPGCNKARFFLRGLNEATHEPLQPILCNHQRSYEYYIESIVTPGGFVSYRAGSYDSFKKGSGFPCANGTCAYMGHYSFLNRTNPGSTGNQFYFLSTGGANNFQRWRHQVAVSVAGLKPWIGSLQVSFCRNELCTSPHTVYSGLITPGEQYSSLTDADKDVYPVQVVVFSWKKGRLDPTNIINLTDTELGASNATLVYGPDGTKLEFCGSGTVPQNVNQTLASCSAPSV